MTESKDENLDEAEFTAEAFEAQEAEFLQLGQALRAHGQTWENSQNWPQFYPRLEERLFDTMESLSFEQEQAALRDHLEQAVEDRQGQWTAFTQRVLEEANRAEIVASRQPLPVQAVQELQADIESTLDDVEPRFENQFFRQLQGQLSQEKISVWQRLANTLSQWMRPPSWAWGSLAVAMMVAFALVFSSPRGPIEPAAVISANKVQVDSIQFEGTVTLSQSEGLTVIWLADASG